MSTLADQISKTELAGRIFSEGQLQARLGGSQARRYGLVNRALKDGSLLRIKRGLYMLGNAYRREPVHPFAVAQALMPGSYISFETALSYHGWIPEAVFATASVGPGRKTLEYAVPGYGTFSFHPLALNDYQFLASVHYLKVGDRPTLIASPLRALMDLVALRKVTWSGPGWVTEGLRIEASHLLDLHCEDFTRLRPVYKHKAATEFLLELEHAVMAMKRAPDKVTTT